MTPDCTLSAGASALTGAATTCCPDCNSAGIKYGCASCTYYTTFSNTYFGKCATCDTANGWSMSEDKPGTCILLPDPYSTGATLAATLLAGIVFLVWYKGKISEIYTLEDQEEFQGFDEAEDPIPFDTRRFVRLLSVFHPIISMIWAPRNDGYTSSRRFFTQCIDWGCSLIVNCLVFKLSGGTGGIAVSIYAAVAGAVFSIFFNAPIAFCVRCTGRNADGCWGAIKKCIGYPCICMLMMTPVGGLVYFGLQEKQLFSYMVLGWGASVGSAFWSGIISTAVLKGLLLKSGAVKDFNEVFREYDIPEKHADGVKDDNGDIRSWEDQMKLPNKGRKKQQWASMHDPAAAGPMIMMVPQQVPQQVVMMVPQQVMVAQQQQYPANTGGQMYAADASLINSQSANTHMVQVQVPAQVQAPSQVRFCGGCGVQQAPGTVFCQNCGAKQA
jgi:hypothetical protein